MAIKVSWVLAGSETNPCCCIDCVTESVPTGENVFSITETEFFDYYNGGTWALSGASSSSESDTAGNVSTADGSGSSSGHASGCSHSVSGTFLASVTYNTSSSVSRTYNYNANMSVSVQLSAYYNTGTSLWEYYAEFAGTADSVSSGSSGGTGYPTTTSLTVDGNALTSHGTWSPGWRYNAGYTNSSSSSMTATFTPDP